MYWLYKQGLVPITVHMFGMSLRFVSLCVVSCSHLNISILWSLCHIDCVFSLLSYSTVACLMLQVRASLYHLHFVHLLYACMVHTFVVTMTSSANSVCPRETVVFTCVTDTGKLLWTVNSVDAVSSFHSINQIKMPVTEQIFDLELVNVTGIDNKTYLSTATANNVLPDYNGTTITCMDGGQAQTTVTLYVQIGEKLDNTCLPMSHTTYNHAQHHFHLHPST